MAGTYTVRDTKTGKVIRKTAFGTKISSVKLTSRAKTVSKNIKSKTVSSSEAKARSEQSLALIARAEQLKQAELDKAKAIKDQALKAEQQKLELQKQLDIATSGKKPDTRKLFNLGYTGNEVTNIVKAYETGASLDKYKKQNVDALFQRLQAKKGRTAVDTTTQTQAYKIAVNQELVRSGAKEVKYAQPIDKFEQALKRVEAIRVADAKTIEKDIKKIKFDVNSIENRILTKQTVTPKEKAIYLSNVKGDITKQQLSIAKKLILAPTNYGRSLVIRKDKGESAPLFNDFKRVKLVGIGALKEVGDTLNFILGVKGVTINSKGESFDGIIATGARAFIDYETKVIREVTQGKSVKSVIGNDLRKIVKTSKMIGKGAVDVVDFVRKNPIATLMLVSSGLEAGVINSKKTFFKNPEENIGRAIVWLFPGTIIKGIKKSAVVVSSTPEAIIKSLSTIKLNKINKILSSKLTVKTKKAKIYAVFKIGKEPTMIEKLKNLSLNEFQKIKLNRINSLVKKQSKTISFKPTLTLKQRKTLLVETITKKLKIPKAKLQKLSIDRINKYVINEQAKVIRFKPTLTLKQRADVLFEKLKNILNIADEKLKKMSLDSINRIAKYDEKKPLAIIRFDKPVKNTKGLFASKRAQAQLPQMMTKQANKLVDETGTIMRKSKTLAKGDIIRFTVGNQQKQKKIVFTVGKQFKQVNIIQQRLKNFTKNLNAMFKNKLIKKSIFNNLITKLTKLSVRLSILKRVVDVMTKTRLRQGEKITDKLTDVLKKIKIKDVEIIKDITIPKKILDQERLKIRTILIPELKKITPITKLKTIKAIKPITKKPLPKIPLPRLNFMTKMQRGKRLKFDMLVKVKGKNKLISLGLPQNKAIARAGRLIDNTTARSMQLIISGTTKIKDTAKPSVLGKFRTRKTKKSLILVEKSKHAIDTRGEKRGLTISRAISGTKRKNAVKKTQKKKTTLKKRYTKKSKKSKK